MSGTIGEHRTAIMLARGELGLEAESESDTRSLWPAVQALLDVEGSLDAERLASLHIPDTTAVTYEGHAAIELEALADATERGRYELPFEDGELDARPTIAAALADRAAGVPSGAVAARFHNALAHATAEACLRIARERDIAVVVLGGGVFQNRPLLEGTARRLERGGVRVLVPSRLPPGDGAISFGQAAGCGRATVAGRNRRRPRRDFLGEGEGGFTRGLRTSSRLTSTRFCVNYAHKS